MRIEGLLIVIIFGLVWWIATYFIGLLEMLLFTIVVGATIGLVLRYVKEYSNRKK